MNAFVLDRAFALSAYDATYLVLARRRALPLAMLDKQLRRAAQNCDVRIVLD